jgi:hypothetical protein
LNRNFAKVVDKLDELNSKLDTTNQMIQQLVHRPTENNSTIRT